MQEEAQETVKICLEPLESPESEERAKEIAVEINPGNQPRRTSPFEIAADWRYLWMPGSTLRVRFLGGHPEVCRKVEDYAHQWEQFANIRFKFVESGPAEIRIAFIPGDGSWSYLGTKALLYPNPQLPTMNYGWLTPNSSEEEFSRVVLHEFGHALGCIHEHMHPEGGIPWDVERAYAFYGRSGWTRSEVDNQVFRKYEKSFLKYSEFDPHSIMIYPIPNEITTGDFSVGWNHALSELDKQFVSDLYPFS